MMRNSCCNRLVYLLGLISFFAMMGCTSAAPEIKIGLIAPLSGEHADSTGLPALNAAQMAVTEVTENINNNKNRTAVAKLNLHINFKTSS